MPTTNRTLRKLHKAAVEAHAEKDRAWREAVQMARTYGNPCPGLGEAIKRSEAADRAATAASQKRYDYCAAFGLPLPSGRIPPCREVRS